ncbi:hypothetical protein RRG08_053936 [Elysia crispata]|uniref:Uncharacterized protein n=1 Tax=Elysia crispata TaxID=231223 RepID=A0AAE1DFA7_9GAST|nr:hypothetical protein RRG08_053936 [Elysia crispata]
MTHLFAGDNNDTDMDYILQESETSCTTNEYDAHTISAQQQISMLTNTNEQTHSSVEESNTDILMRLARALKRGDSELESYSRWETSINSTFSLQPLDIPLLPTSTSAPLKPYSNPPIKFSVSQSNSAPSSHYQIPIDSTLPTSISTLVKTFTDSSTTCNPLKTTPKPKPSVSASDSGTYLLHKGPLIILRNENDTREEEAFTTKLVRRKIKTSGNKSTLF